MEFDFDLLAIRYSESVKDLPESYINLIKNTFGLHSKSRIIDLGCGSGLLTFPLSHVSSFVSGLDISHNMIAIAKSKMHDNNIEWIENDVELFKFIPSYYDLIISYESIHLFPHTEKLLERCLDALKVGGTICMGWCYYNWEVLLENEIVSIFDKYGVEWGEWSYQKFLKFKDIIDSNTLNGFTRTKSNCVKVYQEWSVDEIVEYITSISKAVNLSKQEKKEVKKELKNIIAKKYGNLIKGETQFWIRHSQKR